MGLILLLVKFMNAELEEGDFFFSWINGTFLNWQLVQISISLNFSADADEQINSDEANKYVHFSYCDLLWWPRFGDLMRWINR